MMTKTGNVRIHGSARRPGPSSFADKSQARQIAWVGNGMFRRAVKELVNRRPSGHEEGRCLLSVRFRYRD